MSQRGLRTKFNENLRVDFASEKIVKLKGSRDCMKAVQDCNRVVSLLIMMPRECIYWYEYFIIVGFIIINYIMAEPIFKEKRLNKISGSKFSLKIMYIPFLHTQKQYVCTVSAYKEIVRTAYTVTVRTISSYAETVRTSYAEIACISFYAVCRNGTYVLFLHTEMVHTYVPFLRTKNFCSI